MSGQFKHDELQSGSTRDDVIAVCATFIKAQYMHRAEVAPVPAGKKQRRKFDIDEPEPLIPSRSTVFEDTDDALYVWYTHDDAIR
jgi:hypothetical protein